MKLKGTARQKPVRGSSRKSWLMGGAALISLSLYLFDIVASFCTGFNEHDIQFLSPLLALLRGDLSAQVRAGRVEHKQKRGRCEQKQKGGERKREKLNFRLVRGKKGKISFPIIYVFKS